MIFQAYTVHFNDININSQQPEAIELYYDKKINNIIMNGGNYNNIVYNLANQTCQKCFNIHLD